MKTLKTIGAIFLLLMINYYLSRILGSFISFAIVVYLGYTGYKRMFPKKG